MAKKAEKKATKKDAKQKAVDMTPEKRAIKDMLGRVKYQIYMDTKNPVTGWSFEAAGFRAARAAGAKTISFKVPGEKVAEFKTDDVLLELESALEAE